MRFEYKPDNPAAAAAANGTIAELMLRSGQLQAQRLIDAANLAASGQTRVADIAANAALQQAQIHNGLVTGLINTGTGALGDYLKYKDDAKRTAAIEQAQADNHRMAGINIANAQDVRDENAAVLNASRGAPRPVPAPVLSSGIDPNDPNLQSSRLTDMLPTAGPARTQLPTLTPTGPAETPAAGSLGALLSGPTAPPAAAPAALADPSASRLPAPTPFERNAVPVMPMSATAQIKPTFDAATRAQFLDTLRQTHPQAAARFEQGFIAADKARDEALDAKGNRQLKAQQYVAELVSSVKAANYDPVVFHLAMQHALASEIPGVAEEAARVQALTVNAPERIKPYVDGLIATSPVVQARLQKDAELKNAGQVPVPGGEPIFDKQTQTWIQNPTPKDRPDYTLGDTRYSGTTNQPLVTNERAAAVKEAAAAAARVRAAAASGTAQANKDDTKLMMDGIVAGTLPPLLPGRASPQYVALSAEAARRGFDLAGAVTDWTATQTYIKTMNGNQQLGLRQAIGALPELLDTVQTLADKWDGGQFPDLNRANLALAKKGAYGEDAASIARQLDTQIADVVSDLAVVYMKGNSPTDHGLELARTALAGDWSHKTLTDMVKLARKNVQTRKNSINSAGVSGASEDNPYAPPMPPPPSDLVWVTSPKTGQSFPYKTQAEADAAVAKAKAAGLW